MLPSVVLPSVVEPPVGWLTLLASPLWPPLLPTVVSLASSTLQVPGVLEEAESPGSGAVNWLEPATPSELPKESPVTGRAKA